jgi:hypothetical protein
VPDQFSHGLAPRVETDITKVAAWLPIVIFPQTMAPTFRKCNLRYPRSRLTLPLGRGFPATFGILIAALIVIVGIQLLALRERRQKARDTENNEVSSTDGRVLKDAEYENDKKGPDVATKDDGRGDIEKKVSI